DIIYPLLQTVQPCAPGAEARLINALDPQARWPRPLVDHFARLVLSCVDMVPERRPPFEHIVKVLKELCTSSGCFGDTGTPQQQWGTQAGYGVSGAALPVTLSARPQPAALAATTGGAAEGGYGAVQLPQQLQQQQQQQQEKQQQQPQQPQRPPPQYPIGELMLSCVSADGVAPGMMQPWQRSIGFA
ncbi:unnamed protein product, partial [Polarella glacialis]